MKTIAIGADDAAYAFRDAIVAYLNGLGINVADYSSDKRQGVRFIRMLPMRWRCRLNRASTIAAS
jgi:ribose 5-phosphate isomerase RpiB